MIMREQLFNDFCRERNLSPGSIGVYEHALKNYVKYNGMTLAQLIEEADQEEEQRIRWKRRRLKHRLIDFRNYLIDYGYAKETINTMMKRVTTFYRHHEIEIHHLPRVNIQSTVEIKIPTRDDLKVAVESSKPLMKSLILFMASSGMSKVDVLKLTIEDFITATSDYHNSNDIIEVMTILNGRNDIIPTFALTRTKTNKFYYTFCSPEATSSIVNYLYSRNDKLKPNSKLFKISYHYLSMKFEYLNDTLNLGVTAGNEFRILRCHTLRKYHATTLRDDGLSIDIINSLQGKAKNKVDNAYYIDTPEQLKKQYEEHVNCLYITDEKRYRTELETVKDENTELKTNLRNIINRIEKLENQ